MPTILTLSEKRPAQQQFGLDTFTEIYKCDATADVVLTDPIVRQMLSAHPDYPFMFVTGRQCYETGQTASELNLIYMGCLTDDGEGNPILPAQKPTSGGQITSATTNTDEDIFPSTVTNPATVTFYAITRTLSFISNDPDATDEPSDPPEIDSLITWDLGFGLQPGFSIPAMETYLLTKAFVQAINETPPDIEPIVAGQFYQITKRKTRTLLPYGPAS